MIVRNSLIGMKVVFITMMVGFVDSQQINVVTDNMPPLRAPGGMNLEPAISEVSAMCSADGITAQIMFASPFYGIIYSQQYAQSHECVYYNSFDMNMILFTIPNYACGTQVERNSLNQVSSITNEVYVQYDKDTQTSNDRRFLFICRLVDDFGGNSNPAPGTFTNPPSNNGDPTSNTVTPSQTIIVRTATPTNIVVTQSSLDSPAVAMEVQDGEGPFATLVQRALQLGDAITLVVKADAPGDQMDIFVHSCKAGDGADREVLLIDENGCTARQQVAGGMKRTRDGMGRLIYYFGMKAFKFPGNDDVYFTCSVDLCADCATKTLCPTSPPLNRRFRREQRWKSQPVIQHFGPTPRAQFNVDYDTTLDRRFVDRANYAQVRDYVRVSELPAGDTERVQPSSPSRSSSSRTTRDCVDMSIVYALVSVVAALLVALIAITALFLTKQKGSKTRRTVSVSTSSTATRSTMPTNERPTWMTGQMRN